MVLPSAPPDSPDQKRELTEEDFPDDYRLFNFDLLPRVTIDFIEKLIGYSRQVQYENKWNIAVKLQKRIVELDPQNIASLITLARVLRKKGSLRAALEVHLRLRELQCDRTKRAENEGHINNLRRKINKIAQKTLAPVEI